MDQDEIEDAFCCALLHMRSSLEILLNVEPKYSVLNSSSSEYHLGSAHGYIYTIDVEERDCLIEKEPLLDEFFDLGFKPKDYTEKKLSKMLDRCNEMLKARFPLNY